MTNLYLYKLGLASLQHVFDSLTENGKGVLKLIIKEQINQMAKQKDGPNFKGRETSQKYVFILYKTALYMDVH